MNRKTTTDLMRLVHDELPETEASELRRRIAKDPRLQHELESLAGQWQDLDLPEPPVAPPGFATRVVARAKESTEQGLAPAWWSHTLAGRAMTAVLLAGGIAIGVALAAPSEADEWSAYLDSEPSMAESYVEFMEQPADDSWQENGS